MNTNEYTIIVINNWSNVDNISRILIFAIHALPRNTAKIGRRENFPFYGIQVQIYYG